MRSRSRSPRTLILFFMVRIVSGGSATEDTFLFLFLGNTFFLYVTEVLIGISWAVFRDREDYETLKYIYTAPIHFLPYLLGRGVTKMATATLGVLVALVFGRVRARASDRGRAHTLGARRARHAARASSRWLWLGIILAGASLIVARHSINMNEGLSGLFYLLSGAVFPLEVLPGWARTISLGLPFTYWLELLRRLILGRPYAAPLAHMPDMTLWGVLALSTAVLTVFALLWFRWCEHVARSRGLIDWKSNY
jgi:ABC-2 type transport system permease protein